jgi:N6-L-threonylcarbamoyladenine synthase
MKILAIDTSCDETSAAVTDKLTILSSVVWSQSNIHAKFGGVVPSTAKREHERKISWVVEKAVKSAKTTYRNVEVISVTVGPGLAIALGVGIDFAKKISEKYNKPIIAVNHLEGHVLSALVQKRKIGRFTDSKKVQFPAFGIVVSGGNTLLIHIKNIGDYKVLAQTIDDALGESLDKSARLLGFGYPGGAVLEKFARLGNPKGYPLPLPMLGREGEGRYSYSGLKTAFYRLVEDLKQKDLLSKKQICNLAASYQDTAFKHFIRVTQKSITKYKTLNVKYLLVGGGVAANVELRKKIRRMCKELSITPIFPYSNKLYGDNAAMVGITAYFKYQKGEFIKPEKIDRLPDLKIGQTIQ